MKTIIWKGIFYNSLEYLQLSETDQIIHVQSKIIGSHEKNIYFVEYSLTINKEWEILDFDIQAEINNEKRKFTGRKENNKWVINEKDDPAFDGFKYIDISITPFTNTLPIRNLNLNMGQTREINVIYINILENYIKPVQQNYHKNSETNFRYENVPKNFKADIDIDEQGLVVLYPSLFEMVMPDQR